MSDPLARIRHGLVVSVQAYPGEPMRHPETMARIGAAVVAGGAVGIRAQGVDDIARIRQAVDVPIIGLIKTEDSPVYITPTLDRALAAVAAGADIVALDATDRVRPGGERLENIARELRRSTNAVVLGDVGSLDDVEYAVAAGVDAIATTLAGYTARRLNSGGPDIELVRMIARRFEVPVLAEGRYRTPPEVVAALEAGAHAVVVGSAITHPASITASFVAEIARWPAGGPL